MNTRAWLLLRILIARLPINIAARLLNTHKFLETLGKTLQWINQEAKTPLISKDTPAQQLRESIDESSSATVEASQPVDGKRSKKRKREVADDLPTYTPESMLFNTVALCVSISGTLQQIQARTFENNEGFQGFASEYMKTTIRCTPDQAAQMLSHTLNVMKHLLTDTQYKDPMDNPNITNSLILPIVALWDLRSVVADDITGNSSIVSYKSKTRRLMLIVS